MKLKIALTSFALIILALLASCQAGNFSSPTATPAEASPDASAMPEDQETRAATSAATAQSATPTPDPMLAVQAGELSGVEVVFLHPWTGEAGDEVERIVAEFNLENEWNIRADARPSGGREALYASIDSAGEQGELPDLISAPTEYIAGLQESGAGLVNLSGYILHGEWGLRPEQVTDFTPVFWQYEGTDGERYSLPAMRNAYVLFYNRSWARELGFSRPPQTLEDLRQQACAAARFQERDSDPTNDGTGGWVVDTHPFTALSWLKSFGIRSLPDAASDEWRFNTAQGREAFGWLRELYDDNCAWTGQQTQPHEYFATRRALFYSGELADIPLQANTNARFASPDEWVTLAYPAYETRPVMLVSGESYAIFEGTAEEQMAAWLLLKWMEQPDNQARLARISGMIPASAAAVGIMQDYASEHPQWAAAVMNLPVAEHAPRTGSWRQVQLILGDAFWQAFQSTYIKPEAVPGLLKALDETIAEVLER